MSSIDPPLSDHDLAQLMIGHKLLCNGEAERQALERFIKSVGYYRLEEYTWPYRLVLDSKRNVRSAKFKNGITFGKIKGAYLFDRRLRILLLDAIERFEIALKNRITQVLTQAAASGVPHANDSLFINPDSLGMWRDRLQKTYEASRDVRIIHCKKIHGISHVRDLPLWILMSFATFVDLKKLYELMADGLKIVWLKTWRSLRAFLHHLSRCSIKSGISALTIAAFGMCHGFAPPETRPAKTLRLFLPAICKMCAGFMHGMKILANGGFRQARKKSFHSTPRIHLLCLSWQGCGWIR